MPKKKERKMNMHTKHNQYILILNCRFQLKLSTFKYTHQTLIAWYFVFLQTNNLWWAYVYAILIWTHCNLRGIHWLLGCLWRVCLCWLGKQKKNKKYVYLFLSTDKNLTFHDTFHALCSYYALSVYTKGPERIRKLMQPIEIKIHCLQFTQFL